ncbi:MAG: DNA polymerase, partial [Porticoccaceae bacterium]|nr:DNA polymerase [Porticoccaceae bacterium]
MSKKSPFDFLNSINYSKQNLIKEPQDEKEYVPFIVNRGLGYFQDTIMLANEMNVNCHIDNKMQYDFLKNTVRKRKRFSKWLKAE